LCSKKIGNKKIEEDSPFDPNLKSITGIQIKPSKNDDHKANVTHDIFAIEIKRHFSCNIFFPVWIENVYFWTIMIIETWIEKILKCHYNILKKKYLFIFLWQYCVQKYCVWCGHKKYIWYQKKNKFIVKTHMIGKYHIKIFCLSSWNIKGLHKITNLTKDDKMTINIHISKHVKISNLDVEGSNGQFWHS